MVDGCTVLEMLDVSQCKNLQGWLDKGGIEKCERVYRNRMIGGGERKRLKWEISKEDGGLR